MATENVKATIKGNILTIVIDLAETQGLSGSKKSEIIATTGGNVAISELASGADKTIKIGINCYKPVKK